MRSKLAASLSLFVSLASPPAGAKPFKPARDDEVLLVLPRAIGPRQQADLARLEQALRMTPRDSGLAESLAREYLAIGRRDGDPRYYGMAKAALQPWSGSADAPLGIVELMAEIHGFGHDFASALKAYDEVLAKDPERTSARLARATLYTVIGDLGKAAADCAAMPFGRVGYTECRLILTLAQGDPRAALDLCERGSADAWMLEMIAEAEALAGRPDQAEASFKASLAKEERVFTRIAYADFLLSAGRATDALAILPAASRNLGVMVRRAAALTVSDPKNAELGDLKEALEGTFALEQERGDDVHGRELGLYLLSVKKDPAAALPVARANFAKQKERIDALLLQKAQAAAQ